MNAWIKPSDRLPNSATTVLVAYLDNRRERYGKNLYVYYVAHTQIENDEIVWLMDYVNLRLTIPNYWMEIPEP